MFEAFRKFLKYSAKIAFTAFMVIFGLFFSSWYCLFFFLLFTSLLWSKDIRKLVGKRGYMVMLSVIAIAIFSTMPRYRWNTNDRVRLIYQDEDYNPTHAPVWHYVANLFIPEEALMRMGIWSWKGYTTVEGLVIDDGSYMRHRGMLGQFGMERNRGRLPLLTRQYGKLERSGNFVMSGITPQIMNETLGTKSKAVYVIRPKHYNPDKEYPLVVFAHGYMGNWQAYQGFLRGLDDYIVLSIGTNDISGLFTRSDINDIFTRQLPFLTKLGFKVDKSSIHLIGLSNGGSAVQHAYGDKRFKSLTYFSTNVTNTGRTSQRILVLGGELDHCAGSMKTGAKSLAANGVDVRSCIIPDVTHFALLTASDTCLDFLRENLR